MMVRDITGSQVAPALTRPPLPGVAGYSASFLYYDDVTIKSVLLFLIAWPRNRVFLLVLCVADFFVCLFFF